MVTNLGRYRDQMIWKEELVLRVSTDLYTRWITLRIKMAGVETIMASLGDNNSLGRVRA